MINRHIFTISLFLFASQIWASPRQVTIAWEEKPSAASYDIQVSPAKIMDPIIFEKKIKSATVDIKLEPGTYFYQLRWTKADGKKSPWSEVEGFVVNSGPPQPVYPLAGTVISKMLPATGINFRWTQGIQATISHVQINDKNGVVLSQTSDSNQLDWEPRQAGKYRWQVGFASVLGVEWGEPIVFEVQESAINRQGRIDYLRLLRIQGVVDFEYPSIKTVTLVTKDGTRQINDRKRLLYVEALWNPELEMTTELVLRAIAGGFFAETNPPKDASGTDRVESTSALFIHKIGILGAWMPTWAHGLGIEAGPGAQVWFWYSDTSVPNQFEVYPAAFANLTYSPKWTGWEFLNRFNIGVEAVPYSERNPYRAIKLGTTFAW